MNINHQRSYRHGVATSELLVALSVLVVVGYVIYRFGPIAGMFVIVIAIVIIVVGSLVSQYILEPRFLIRDVLCGRCGRTGQITPTIAGESVKGLWSCTCGQKYLIRRKKLFIYDTKGAPRLFACLTRGRMNRWMYTGYTESDAE